MIAAAPTIFAVPSLLYSEDGPTDPLVTPDGLTRAVEVLKKFYVSNGSLLLLNPNRP